MSRPKTSVRLLRTRLLQITLVLSLASLGIGTSTLAQNVLFSQADSSAISTPSWYGDNWYQLGTGFSGTLQSLTIKCYTSGGNGPSSGSGSVALQEFSDSAYSVETNSWQLSGVNGNPSCQMNGAAITFLDLDISLNPSLYYRLYTLDGTQNASVRLAGTSSFGYAMYDNFISGVGGVQYFYTFYPYLVSNIVPSLPACPPSQLDHSATGSLPVRLACNSSMTVNGVGLWTSPVSGPYCCSQSYVTINSDQNNSPGAVIGTSSIVTISQSDPSAEQIYSFSPPLTIPAGTAFWVSLNEGPSSTTNPTSVAGSSSPFGGPFLDFQSSTATASITPPFVNFQPGMTPVTVTNTGNSPLIISSLPAVVGFNAVDFTTGGDSTCGLGTVIPPRNSCVITITFSPTTNLWEVATLVVFDNAGAGVQTVPLSGGGQIATISPNPVPALDASQMITISGTNFAIRATVNWQDLATLQSATITPDAVSPSIVTATKNFGASSAVWQIEVVQGNVTSNWYPFEVGDASASGFLDDYPFKNAPPGSNKPDHYNFFFDECTSFVAWRMNRDSATPDPSNPSFFNGMAGGLWRNANNWALNASSLGYTVNTTPEVGSIAQWTNGCGGKCSSGHVAYVENIHEDGSVDVSEYNYAQDDGKISNQYGLRNIAFGSTLFPPAFIHIPRLPLSSPHVDFGAQRVGTASSQKITLTNTLASAISLSASVNPSIAGIGTTDFTESNTCTGSSLPSGSECEINVTFAPPSSLTTGGARSASLTLNWGAGPQLVPVSGIALVNFTPSKQNISFGSVAVGTMSTAKTVTLKNQTGADLNISSVVAGGGFTATGCVGALVQGASCTVTVIFTPTSIGPQTSILTISDDAINSPQAVSLTGNGVQPVVVTPIGLTFGTQSVGTQSLAKTIKITNNLSTALSISGMTVAGADQNDFFISSSTCESILGASASCTVSVIFAPTARGSRQAFLNVSNSFGIQTVALSGKGK